MAKFSKIGSLIRIMFSYIASKRKTINLFLLSSFLLLALGNNISFASEQGQMAQNGKDLFLPLVYKGDIDLFISDVKIIQGTTLSDKYQVYIADRDAFMRVFVGLEEGSEVTGVTGKLCGYDQTNALLGCIPADNTSINTPSFEASLASTLNFRLPEGWLKPGYAYHVEIDPDHHFADGNPENNRYPEQGIQPFNFVSASSLNVVVVPVAYRPYPSNETFYPQSDDLTYLTPYPIALLPIPTASYQTHVSVTYLPTQSDQNLDSNEGWLLLLNLITSVQDMEDPSGVYNYYGLVNSYDAHGCDGGCTTGVANLGGKAAVGWSGLGTGSVEASITLVHELGHNFGRKHVLCTGEEEDIDRRYPYSDASIGQFGLDVQEGILYDPAIYKSFMSYCQNIWTSDYTYWNIFNYRRSRSGANEQSGISREAIYVRGILSPDGGVTLLPVYRQTEQIVSPTVGPYSLDLLDANGMVLETYPFEMIDVPDAAGYKHFGFFVPAPEGVDGLRLRMGDEILVEKIITSMFEPKGTGKDGLVIDDVGDRIFVRWPEVYHPIAPVYYRLRISMDEGHTWQVLTLDWKEAGFLMPPGLGNFWLEVQASDGIHTSTRVYPLESAP